ncbi:hypothetical protein CAPTEDRAFT_198378 [Capitella teleta]|uniref:ADF-H domain-containing protein n=1 Tax=Capitella teleta TaxID=283909 RepID=R7UJW5_CAPTE|nr:hypothetical protein CAPTEDRAFT_198378 [Capitella teleta]|eukprot:ELU06393.1 hypothetical protein CAPTEDRAFT_198378 [Capitella teleta]
MSSGGALATEIEILDVGAFNAALAKCRQPSSGVPRTAWLILAHVDGDVNKVQLFGQNSGVLATVAGWKQRLVPDRILYSLLNISIVEQDAVVAKYVYVLLSWLVQLGDKPGGMNASLVTDEASRLPLRPPTAPLVNGLGVSNDLTLAISQVRETNGAINWVIAAFKDYAACKALSLIAKGFGRIDPMKEHLDESQVMYILLRVNATKDSCPTTKMLLIKWCVMIDLYDELLRLILIDLFRMGGDVKPLARGQRTQFPGAVEKAFAPYHATISCSGQEEFTEEHVAEKVKAKLGADIAISW